MLTMVIVLICLGFIIADLIIVNIVPRVNGSEESADLETSIAVLPFANWNSDSEYEYLGEAFTDEIILQLWDADAFDRVLSRTSAMHFKNESITLPEIAEGDWSEISLFQNDITKKVARELKVALSPSHWKRSSMFPQKILKPMMPIYWANTQRRDRCHHLFHLSKLSPYFFPVSTYNVFSVSCFKALTLEPWLV